MSDVALYFPYVNLPGDAWVKAAALYWTQLGRIRPRGYYGLRDTDTVKRLVDELGFVVDVDVRRGGASWIDDEAMARIEPYEVRRPWMDTEDQVDAVFYDFLDRYKDELIPRYGAAVLGVESLDTWEVYDRLLPVDSRLEKVHPAKLTYGLARRLAGDGLLVSRRYQWRRESDGKVLHISDLLMHRRLAGVYLALLADVTAGANGMTPVTDQALTCAAASGWTIETMAQLLLTDENAEDAVGEPEVGDYSHAFAVLALQTVVPKDLADVPVERVIEARRRLLPDLMRYREFLDSLVPDFVEISALPDPEVRAARLRNHVERHITQPVEAMERQLGRLGLQPVRAVLSMQTLVPPAALGVLTGALHLPTAVTGAGVVAGCLVGATNGVLDQRRQVRAEHPAGYLLHLRRELGPSDTVARIRSGLRRAMPGRRRRR